MVSYLFLVDLGLGNPGPAVTQHGGFQGANKCPFGFLLYTITACSERAPEPQEREILNANFRTCLCCGDFGLPIPQCPAGKVQGQGAQVLLHPVLWLLCEPQPAVLALPMLRLIPTTSWNARKARGGSMLLTSSQPQHISAWERSESQGPHRRVQQEQGDISACPGLL